MIQVIQLIVALSLLVVIHEFGHYMFARMFNVRVNKFYMFFNSKISLMRAKRFNGKWHFAFFSKNIEELKEGEKAEDLPDDDWRKYPDNTEWGIGWIPFGGYCAIDGMVDETTKSDQLDAEPKPWEYRSQKAWKRMLIISGGVLMNFVGAIVIYILMLFVNGESYIPLKNAYLGYDYCNTALKHGFVNGDIIKSVNGHEVETTKDVTERIIIEGLCDVQVDRNGEEERVLLPTKFSEEVVEANEQAFMQIRFPFTVGEIVKGSPAEKAGLMAGDSIMAVDSIPVVAASDFVAMLDSMKGKEITLTIARNGNTHYNKVTPDTAGKIGFAITPELDGFETVEVDYNFLEAIPAGCVYGWETLVNYIKQFRLVFTKAGAKSVGGFIAIGKIFPSSWSWLGFWSITAFLSIILAFMNILPIPVLDGGYLLMLIVEMITGKKPSDKFMNIALNIGMFLLLALLIYANGNDIFKLIMGK
ncbi:MAG: RIP metalloprotease RseP [Paludibacteraceae bacterium]|nr:RIP metalloprotease RseP [Paludibacteraceae bacterium]